MTLNEAIFKAAKLRAENKAFEDVIDANKKKLEPLEAQIIEHAETVAESTDTGGRKALIDSEKGPVVTVTFPRPSLKLTEENLAAAKKLAGVHWAKLTEKIPVQFSLVKAARDLALALLPRAAAEKFLGLLESQNSPRLTYK